MLRRVTLNWLFNDIFLFIFLIERIKTCSMVLQKVCDCLTCYPYIHKLLVFRWRLIVNPVLLICFYLGKREASCFVTRDFLLSFPEENQAHAIGAFTYETSRYMYLHIFLNTGNKYCEQKIILMDGSLI